MGPKKTAKLIRALIKANEDAHEIIENLDAKGIEAVCECLFNLCYSHHLNLPTRNKNKLRHKMHACEKTLRKVCCKSLSPTLKRRLLRKVKELRDILKLAWPAIQSLTQDESNEVNLGEDGSDSISSI